MHRMRRLNKNDRSPLPLQILQKPVGQIVNRPRLWSALPNGGGNQSAAQGIPSCPTFTVPLLALAAVSAKAQLLTAAGAPNPTRPARSDGSRRTES